MPQLIRLVDKLSRRHKQWVMVGVDFMLLSFAVWASYSLRLTEWFTPDGEQWVVILLAPVFAIPVFIKLGLYRAVIRYAGEHALLAVLKGLTIATILWGMFLLYSGISGFERVPRSLPGIYWFISVFLVGGSRFFLRWLLSGSYKAKQRNVVVVGANAAGRELLASLKKSRELWPVAIIDDDASLRGRMIDGVRVYGMHAFHTLYERFDIQDAIVLESAFTSARRKEIIEQLKHHGVSVRVLPAVSEIASGRVLVNALRPVEIEDLLGREPVPPVPELLSKTITDKCVLITGAGGSIGAELARQILALSPQELVLLDSSEFQLYAIEHELQRAGKVVPVLANVCDVVGLDAVFAQFKPDTVYHAAAYKHVPMIEANMLEGIKNNVFGTLNTVEAAKHHGASDFVLISTDKAVRPPNVMGATKRLAELILQAQPTKATTRFSMVRFGNVLGSSGSVVPLFRKQIKDGGPVTVTHPEVTRYFMTITEAAQLVIQAGAMAEGGDVFLLDMGEPIKIIDLARKMIELSGKTVCDAAHPDGDIEIQITGLRPGEKLYEELLIGSASRPTSHPRIFKANETMLAPAELEVLLAQLSEMLEQQARDAAKALVLRVANIGGKPI